MNLVCNVLCRAIALGYDDDMVVAALDAADTHFLYDLGVEIQLTLGQADCGRADCTANLQCQMTCTAAHNLYNRAALVGLHGVAQLIDALDRGIAGGVKTDGVIRAADIIINGTRNADARNSLAGKRLCTTECTVTAAADQAVNTEVAAGVSRLLQTFLGQHFLAACGVQHGAAVYTAGTHLDDVTVDETAVAAANAENGNIVCACAADYRADKCVHTGCVAAAGKYADSANLFIHDKASLLSGLFSFLAAQSMPH